MPGDTLHTLLRGAEGKTFRFVFTDGDAMLAKVVSTTHLDADDTVVLVRVGAPPGECGWQVKLADFLSVATPDGDLLFRHT